MILRAWFERGIEGKQVSLVAVAGDISAENLAYLIRHDSTQGRFPGTVSSRTDGTGQFLTINGHEVAVLSGSIREPLPWSRHAVEVVVDSDLGWRMRQGSRDHLHAGARRVVVAGPARDADLTLLPGINGDQFAPDRHRIISCAVPSAHALALLVHVLLREGFGVETGHLTTIRAVWPGQSIVDGFFPADWRGGRAAWSNIVPETTGVGQWVGIVLPAVKGRLAASTFLVPSGAVSVADFTVRTIRPTSLAEISAAMKHAANTDLQGLLGYTEEPLVSADFVHTDESCVFDRGAALELGDRTFKLVGWYDAEWAYACRMCELVEQLGGR